MIDLEYDEISSGIKAIKPYRRVSYIAMLLGFYPCNYNKDYEDEEIIYGDVKYSNLNKQLTYIQCKRVLIKHGFNDEKLLEELYQDDRWDEIEKLFIEYKASKTVLDNGLWRFFVSKILENNESSYTSEDIKHRLYIRIGLEQRANFVDEFINLCSQSNNPYYLKVFTHKGQADTVVLYTTDDNLVSTIDIINEMYLKNNEELKDSTKTPAPHLYKINDQIGYAYEPKTKNVDLSFTDLMKECARDVSNKQTILRNKIIDDLSKGKIYKIGDVERPKITESKKFVKLSKNEQYEFFLKYFKYIRTVYVNEIFGIIDEIEHNERLVTRRQMKPKLTI